MRNFKIMTGLTLLAVGMYSLTITSDQSKRSFKKNGLELSKLRVGITKALAAAPAGHHQDVYDMAKDEVNMEITALVDGINTQLTAASISSCENIPAVSATAFHTSTTYDLYSSAVGVHAFPISTVAGASFDVKLELKLAGTATTIGALYVDCSTGAAEVRYMGRLDTVENGDTDLIIAYHNDETTSRESILLVSDYDASPGNYAAGKLAIHYIEGASSQTITYAAAEGVASGLSGTLTANTSGTVTDAVDGDVTGTAAATDLNSMMSIGTYSIANVWGLTVTL